MISSLIVQMYLKWETCKKVQLGKTTEGSHSLISQTMKLRLRAKVTSTRVTDAAETRTLFQCVGEKIMSWSQEMKVQN